VDSVKTGKIDITPVHDIECAGLYVDLIEDVHIVHFPMSNHDHCGNASPEIEKGVEFHRPFAFSEFCPGEKRQTQIDSRRIQCIDGVDPGLSKESGVELPRSRDEHTWANSS